MGGGALDSWAAGPRSVRRTVAQFAVTGLVAVALLGFVAVQLLRSSGTSDAIADAKRLSRLAGDSIAAPLLTPALLRGEPDAVRRLDRALRRPVVRGPFVRVKVWDATGRIVYSDEHRLIGARYALGAEDLEALRHGRLDAEISDLSEPENRFERRYGQLLEVYDGIRAPDGRRLLFESYQPFSSIAASGRRTWLRFLPALLAVAVAARARAGTPRLPARAAPGRARARAGRTPPARARRVGPERRRIARDLHDGPVQTLAGVAFSLGAPPSGSTATTRRSARWSSTRRAGRARPCASSAAPSSTSTPPRWSAGAARPGLRPARPAGRRRTRDELRRPRELRLPADARRCCSASRASACTTCASTRARAASRCPRRGRRDRER